jgi:hypothetical protein
MRRHADPIRRNPDVRTSDTWKPFEMGSGGGVVGLSKG